METASDGPINVELCQIAATAMDTIISNSETTLSRDDRIEIAETIGSGILDQSASVEFFSII